MSFRYINPGYVALLEETSKNAVQVKNSSYCSNGVGYYKLNTTQILNCDYANSDEFFAKFDFYFPDNESFDIYLYPFNTWSGLKISCNSSASYVYLVYQSSTNKSVSNENTNLKRQTINTIYYYANWATNEVLVKVNGKTIFSIQNYSRMPYRQQNYIVLTGGSATAPISNIIISDEYIDPKEQVISLPISSTESDMTFDSETGIYTATATNQSLLSAVNVDALAEEYGSDSQVTGVALVGNPAYKTAEGLSSLTAFSKDSSGSVTEYGTYALDSDSSGVIADSQILTGKTISDLQNLKFGWIAK